jgi:glutamyl-tRNA synthetase
MTDTQLRGPIRVRFAPSPTGFLHVGGARTAIYNDLLRQSLGGAFVLRIEDTDRQRSDQEMTRQIVEALRWIGVVWDEGPVLQSERLARHQARAHELVAAGKAYRCYRTREELDELRQRAEKGGESFYFRGERYPLPAGEEERRTRSGEPHAIRFRAPDEPVRFHDLVRGEVVFGPQVLEDFVLLRSDGSPTYHLSAVVDDIDMAITHVVRGEDHLSNTPKHVPLFLALGAPVPVFCHLPLILGPDKKRLSKRIGSTSVEEFRAEGILPQALYNFLALLGWNPGDDRELLSRGEMIELFTVERLNAKAAVFDREKLLWMNGQYLMSLAWEQLSPHLMPFLAEVGLLGADEELLRRAVDLHRPRSRTLRELAECLTPYFQAEIAYDPGECARFLQDPALPRLLDRLRQRYRAIDPYTVEALDLSLRELAAEVGVKPAALIHPLRMALTGTGKGPGVFDVVALCGRASTEHRLTDFLRFLHDQRAALPPA